MASSYGDRATGSLAATGAGTAIGPTRAVTLSLKGTWVGTVTLQRKIDDDWVDVKDASWTANEETTVLLAGSPHLARVNFTRTSGTVEYYIAAAPSSV